MVDSASHGHSGTESRLSMAMENYLLSILRLNEQEVIVTLTKLAEFLKMHVFSRLLNSFFPKALARVLS